MKKKATHSGKQSNQEKAANERAEFNIQYDHDTAASVLDTYKTKAQEIKDGDADAQEYTCTGKEFLLPPVDADVEEGPAENIVKVMLERDRLTNIIKNTPVGKTPYAKAKRACDEKLLAYMNDMINTYMKASNVDQKTGRAVKASEVEAAKNHMALAMEKYEMFARNYEENIGELMQSSIKKSAGYKAYLETHKQERKTEAEEDENELLDLIASNKKRVGNKFANVKKVYADFEKLNAKYAELAAASEAMLDYERDLNDADEKRIVLKLLDKSEIDRDAVEFAKNACKAYIESITKGEPMNLVDAAYIQKHFGINDATMSLKPGVVLDMNKPIFEQSLGLSEYDDAFRVKMSSVMAEAKNELDIYTEEEIKASEALRRKKAYVEKYYQGLEGGSFRNMVNAFLYVNPEYNRLKASLMDSVLLDKYGDKYTKRKDDTRGGTRDTETLFIPLEGETMSQEEYETLVINYIKTVDRYDLANDKEISDEEMRKAFDDLMPHLRAAHMELVDYRNMNKDFFNGQKDPEKISDLFDGYEKFFYLGSKGQAMKQTVERIAGNEALEKLLSEEEKHELFDMAQEAAVWMNYTRPITGNIDQILRATPNGVLEKKPLLVGKGINYENSYKEGYKLNKIVLGSFKFNVSPTDEPKVKMSEN